MSLRRRALDAFWGLSVGLSIGVLLGEVSLVQAWVVTCISAAALLVVGWCGGWR